MKKTDARTLLPATQETLRKQAIRLKKQGKSFVEIASIVGVHRNTVSNWWNSYQDIGLKGIMSKKRGRHLGELRTLSPSQEIEIQNLIIENTPDQLKFSFALWTRKAIQLLIKQQLGITMPIRTVGEYLKRWGFTPQKPLKRAYEQQPSVVRKWLDTKYPEIVKKAKQENAEIHWGDETGLRNNSQHGRSFSPKGKTPVIKLSAKRASINMISTVSNQGKVRFMVYKTTMTAQVLIKFMKRLIKGSRKKLFLILDNLRVHHAYLVRDWVKANKDKIEIFYLPAYSPELNPDEYLNCDLKSGVHSKPPARTTKELQKNVISHMRKLQKKPNHVIKYFKHPKINYAA